MPFFTLEMIMKIRIDEVGYEYYTGVLGLVEFVDGVSINDVAEGEVNRMAAVLRVVSVDTEKQIGALVDYATISQVGFEREGELVIGADSPVGFVDVDAKIPEGGLTGTYTQEQLEALADKEGIAGLRVIGESLDVKGTSIKGLIDSILAVASK